MRDRRANARVPKLDAKDFIRGVTARFITTAWLLASPAASAALAQDTPLAGSELCARPEPRTPVLVALYLNDVSFVDDAHLQASVDLAMRLTWRDPRLAGRFAEPTLVSIETLWSPRFTVVSDRTLERRLPEKVIVQPDGTVRYVQRLVGDVAFPMDLAEFPFDDQTLGITVLFLTLPDEAVFTADRDVPLVAPSLSVPAWFTGPARSEIEPGSIFSPAHWRAVLTLELRRQRTYYVWTVIVPLALVVAMGVMPFWIERSIEARVGLAATSVLTLIAFRFALSQMVPPLAYFTRLDAFVLVATLIVFASLLAVGANSFLTETGRQRSASILNWVARVALPAAFAVFGIAALALPRS